MGLEPTEAKQRAVLAAYLVAVDLVEAGQAVLDNNVDQHLIDRLRYRPLKFTSTEDAKRIEGASDHQLSGDGMRLAATTTTPKGFEPRRLTEDVKLSSAFRTELPLARSVLSGGGKNAQRALCNPVSSKHHHASECRRCRWVSSRNVHAGG